MKLNPYFLFFALLLVPFIVYFARPDFAGVDSYGYLVQVCKNNGIIDETNLFNSALFLFPCNFLAIKATLFLCALFSGFAVIKMATLFSKKNGWRVSYLVFLAPVFVLEFIKFENEQFAYPLLFWSAYFFYLATKKGGKKNFLCSFLLLGFAGMVWRGAIYYLIAFALTKAILFVPIAVAALIPNSPIYWTTILGNAFRTSVVFEDAPFHSLTYLFALNLGLMGIIFLEWSLLAPTIMLFFLALASAKFSILVVPFLAVGLVKAYDRLEKSG